ncbi:hypothetical protein TNIN_258011 [Trichonephila inaurata madagascariensis]|uniref:Uncharacterized protein n=1 Tax=Trichonephila inaurata madagascariensis TaxID=2747483 RepID=A0A8X6XV67_9ARAC|nr:hypothetical protein TNIN_258011 [Trichonephila inaurata madagascariensis]
MSGSPNLSFDGRTHKSASPSHFFTRELKSFLQIKTGHHRIHLSPFCREVLVTNVMKEKLQVTSQSAWQIRDIKGFFVEILTRLAGLLEPLQ